MFNPKKTKNHRQYLRKNMTKWEVRLWNDLKGRKMLGFKIRRQYGIDNYILDFYCPKLKMGIEVDGEVHYFPEKIKSDKKKDQFLNAMNIDLIRIKTADLEEGYESVIIYLEDLFKARAVKPGIES